MISRTEAARFWNDALLDCSQLAQIGNKVGWHIGKVEIKQFMDLLYAGPPTCEEEEIKRSW